MTWFRVDDTAHSHPKVRQASLAAVGLWTLSGSFSMNYKTDGFVPEWFIKGIPRATRLADELVRVGLWERVISNGEPGWRFHDWDHFQESAGDIEAARQRGRERQRAWRAKARAAKEKGTENA